MKPLNIKPESLEGKPPMEILAAAVGEFGKDRIALACSFGAEDVVLVDMLRKTADKPRIFMLDTGRLHEETYQIFETCRELYRVEFEVLFPDGAAVEKLTREKGMYSFRESVENRKECCRIRKVEPLKRALATMDCWITGLRRAQSVTRTGVKALEEDADNGLYKLNPLIDWSERDVWDYIGKNNVPYNKLHDRNFPSIGCSPCTRAVREGEDVRAGRWWWENPDTKECGLHPGGSR